MFTRFVGAVSIHGVRERFLRLVFGCPCGAGRFSLCAGSVVVRVVVRSSFGSVSSDRV